MSDVVRASLLIFATLLSGCGDDVPGSSGSSSSTGSTEPSFTDCQDCPIGGTDVCPAGQVCVSRIPGSGGICVLACEQDNPEPCTFKGVKVGGCEPFSPDDTPACTDPDNGAVCPPAE